jgi:hypothetical protein
MCGWEVKTEYMRRGMMGQYAFAAGWGVVVDRIGPWA